MDLTRLERPYLERILKSPLEGWKGLNPRAGEDSRALSNLTEKILDPCVLEEYFRFLMDLERVLRGSDNEFARTVLVLEGQVGDFRILVD